MGSVSVLRAATGDAKTFDSKTQKQDGAQTECRVISLHATLETENERLRQEVVELLLGTSALREAVKQIDAARRATDSKRSGSKV